MNRTQVDINNMEIRIILQYSLNGVRAHYTAVYTIVKKNSWYH